MVIFVIDSNDRERLKEASEDFHRYLANQDELENAAFLILANKQDLPHAASVSEICEAMKLHSLHDNRKWFIQGCCAITGDGLYEGLDWVVAACTGQDKKSGGISHSLKATLENREEEEEEQHLYLDTSYAEMPSPYFGKLEFIA